MHSLLADLTRREAYDEDGILMEAEADAMDSSDKSSFDVWKDYWHTIFPSLSMDDIKAFERKYKHSKEERADLLEGTW